MPNFFLFCIYAYGSELCFTGNSFSARPVKLWYIPERVSGLWCTDLSIIAHGFLMYATNGSTGGQEEAMLAVEWVLLLAVESHSIPALPFAALFPFSLCPPVFSKYSSWFLGYLAWRESLLNMAQMEPKFCLSPSATVLQRTAELEPWQPLLCHHK